jgi:ferritin-like metal-binding protein YciE
MYSVEEQALAQLVSAPDLAGDPSIAADFRRHYTETERQAALIGARLEAHGETPSAIKGAIMKLGGKGFLLFAQAMPETPGRLVAHAYSYEAMEWAGYEMLIRFAEAAGDSETASVARTIRDEERTMMERLEGAFDAAEQASHRDNPPDPKGDDLRKHIAEAHALENQGIKLLGKSTEIAGEPEIGRIYSRNLARSRKNAELLEGLLEKKGGSPSGIKDAALGIGGLNWGFFFQGQADTPAKLAAFAYAYEHLKIAGYELLKRTAKRAGDVQTICLCEDLLAEERSMVKTLSGTFDAAVEATLAAVHA